MHAGKGILSVDVMGDKGRVACVVREEGVSIFKVTFIPHEPHLHEVCHFYMFFLSLPLN